MKMFVRCKVKITFDIPHHHDLTLRELETLIF